MHPRHPHGTHARAAPAPDCPNSNVTLAATPDRVATGHEWFGPRLGADLLQVAYKRAEDLIG